MASQECDHPGCNKEIDRSLPYACGACHGKGKYSCTQYFCFSHLIVTEKGKGGQLCETCYENMEQCNER